MGGDSIEVSEQSIKRFDSVFAHERRAQGGCHATARRSWWRIRDRNAHNGSSIWGSILDPRRADRSDVNTPNIWLQGLTDSDG
jgi:hypothetical protein